MNTFSHVPPGFRFHPTDEELVDYYLRKKIASRKIDLDVIKDVDLYKIEPWDLQEKCRIGAEEQNEWYFFSHKDKKYPTGTRTNRATTAGFWKATGRDKPIYARHSLVGMRKTLVFYQGRAPNGQKSDWIMHEYRLETNENATPQEEGWVVCRVFKKRVAPVRRASEHDHLCWYDDQVSFNIPDFDSPRRMMSTQNDVADIPYQQPYSFKQELDLQYRFPNEPNFLQLPQLESPTLLSYVSQQGIIPLKPSSTTSLAREEQIQQSSQQQIMISLYTASSSNTEEAAADQVTDWRVLDKFVASQLSQGDVVPEEPNYSNSDSVFPAVSDKEEPAAVTGYASTSISNCQINDLWK